MRSSLAPLGLLCLCLPACLIPEGSKPAVSLGVDVATQYNHRGMPQNTHGVAQPAAAITLPAAGDGALTLTTWGNLDLTDDTGDAWYPDGNALRFSEIDYIAAYAKSYGDVNASFGVHNYNLPRGDRFPFGVRGATVELFGRAEYDLHNGLFPFGELRVDIDEAEGYYVKLGCLNAIPIRDKLDLGVEAYLSYSDSKQAFWNYGLDEAGLADARLTATLSYHHSESTTLTLFAAYSTMIDGDYRDEFSDDGIDADNFWIGTGVSWGF